MKDQSKERASNIGYRSGPREDDGDGYAMLQAREGGAGVEVGAGQGVELHCHSQGGRPPAEIHWWDSDTGSRLVADMRGGYIQGGPKKSVFSKNENRPWWVFFEKKIHDQ